MPRLPRINVEESLLFISSIGNQGEDIFKQKEDYQMYLELLKKYKEQYGFKVFSFVLMPSQVNLLVELKEGATISMVMHDLNSSYTKYFNKSYQRKGHLFQERFKSVIVEKDHYLLSMVSHTHFAPVRLGLVRSISEYVYSSHLLYLYNNHKDANVLEAEQTKKVIDIENEIKEVLDVLAKVYPEKKGYLDYIQSLTQEDLEDFGKKLHRARIIGSEQFLERAKAQLSTRLQEPEEKKFPIVPVVSISLVAMLSSAVLGIWYVKKNIAKPVVMPPQIIIKEKIIKESELPLTELDGTEWPIEINTAYADKVFPGTDKITFEGKKIFSRELLSKGFSATNYTMTLQEDGAIVWETIQSAPDSTTASWRAEVRQGKMEGILSLRKPGKNAQDFSFTSKGYKRKG